MVEGPSAGIQPVTTCSVDGCETGTPITKSGMCRMHNMRFEKHGDVGPVGRLIAAPYRGALCAARNCTAKAVAKGLCPAHWWRKNNEVNLDTPINHPYLDVCAAVGCNDSAIAKDFCSRHYQRVKKFGDAETNLNLSKRSKMDEDGRKQCKSCLEFLKLESFHSQKSGVGGVRSECKACCLRRTRAVKYRIDIDEKLESQRYKCAVCGKEIGLSCHVDHDHSCCPGLKTCGLCVRGLLCSKCNQGLGFFDDDTELMLKAICYLETYKI